MPASRYSNLSKLQSFEAAAAAHTPPLPPPPGTRLHRCKTMDLRSRRRRGAAWAGRPAVPSPPARQECLFARPCDLAPAARPPPLPPQAAAAANCLSVRVAVRRRPAAWRAAGLGLGRHRRNGSGCAKCFFQETGAAGRCRPCWRPLALQARQRWQGSDASQLAPALLHTCHREGGCHWRAHEPRTRADRLHAARTRRRGVLTRAPGRAAPYLARSSFLLAS